MRTRVSIVTASLLGIMAMLPCRAASAEEPERYVDGLGVEKTTTPPMVVFSPPLEPGWWRAITAALDGMRGLRGRRIPPAAAKQVDLHLASERPDRPLRWQELPPVTRRSPYRLELRLGPVHGMPVQVEPLTASIVDLRGESGELLGAWMTLPWLVP